MCAPLHRGGGATEHHHHQNPAEAWRRWRGEEEANQGQASISTCILRPRDGYRHVARDRRVICGVVIVSLRWIKDLAQPKFEMVWSQRHTLEIALKELAIIVGQLLRAAAGIEVVAQCRNDQRLDLGRGN